MSVQEAVLEFDFRLTDSEYSTIHHALLTLSREQAVPEYRQMYLDLIIKLDQQSFNRLRAWERGDSTETVSSELGCEESDMNIPKGFVPSRINSAKLITVVRIETAEGQGITDDPVRRIVYLCDPEDGNVLARIDTMASDTAVVDGNT